MPKTSFVLGGARSGKTAYALSLAAPPRVYVATAIASDDEMGARIAAHRAERGTEWRLMEAPMDLARALADIGEGTIVVDCLTLWLSNLMADDRDIDAEVDALVGAIRAASADIIFVSNEIGMGLVPMDALSRRFRDAQGRLNQRIAALSDSVEFVAAGLPLRLK